MWLPVAALALGASWLSLASAPPTESVRATEIKGNVRLSLAGESQSPTGFGFRLPRPVVVKAALIRRVPPVTGATGLSPNAAALVRYIQHCYPEVPSIGGVRSDPLPDHPTGHAVDVMVYRDTALGNRIADDIQAHAAQFGVRYLIWQETYRKPNGYRSFMADRGSLTANHRDHVHITVN